ncbi:MAG TPA: TetR/AcrR family transcriptional regulator [Acidimicrobiia bacterium]|nr:TetR/AcrR family transcriptional regulator [Acidimicrobiia bacterium]
MTQDVSARPRAHDRRATMIRAAYKVMARDGVHRVPLQQIATEAGVSKGLLLYHFQTKDGLVLASLEWVLEATEGRIRQRLAESGDPAGAMSDVIDAIWVSPEANRDFFRFYLDGVEHQARSPEFDEFADKGRSIMNSFYRELIVAGAERGMLWVDDPTVAAIQMRAVIEGMFLQWLQTTDWRANHGRYKEHCRQALLRVLGATSS